MPASLGHNLELKPGTWWTGVNSRYVSAHHRSARAELWKYEEQCFAQRARTCAIVKQRVKMIDVLPSNQKVLMFSARAASNQMQSNASRGLSPSCDFHPQLELFEQSIIRDTFITTHTGRMASLARTSMLRQATLLSRRSLSTSTTAIKASSFLRPTTAALLRQSPLASRIAPFSSTSKTQILPPGPQVINGGVNDPAPVPKASPTHGSYHWTFERLLAVAIIPLTIAPFAAGHVNAAVDAALVFTILLHSHIGFQ